MVLGVQGKYVDERFATDVNDQAAPSYTVFDADLRYSFPMFGRESFVQLNVINLADKDYTSNVQAQILATPASAAYWPGDGRRVFGGVRVGF